MNIPKHVAIILDGNGRWAKSKNMPRNYGHTAGAKNVEKMTRVAHDMGIRYLTVYAFSTENWNRPDSEVKALMVLLESYLKTCVKTANKNNMKVRIIGDISKLSTDLQDKIWFAQDETKNNTEMVLTIAINYGSRDEMLRAFKKMIEDEKQGIISKEQIDESLVSSYLDTYDMPDPDLLIRTSGEQRLSNFLLWQLAYSEFYFTDVPWPDFDENELKKAIIAYNSRDRRFGALKEE